MQLKTLGNQYKLYFCRLRTVNNQIAFRVWLSAEKHAVSVSEDGRMTGKSEEPELPAHTASYLQIRLKISAGSEQG